jgi:hypothetical protein
MLNLHFNTTASGSQRESNFFKRDRILHFLSTHYFVLIDIKTFPRQKPRGGLKSGLNPNIEVKLLHY